MSDGAGGPRPNPTFSVVMIFHNEERFLPEAVDSVLAQSGPTWELLLVDDGSTDRSAAIARDWAATEPHRISVLSHDGGVNRGMSASRNLGIANAVGRLITFLDADDVWLPGKLQAQQRLLDRYPEVDVLVSPAQWWRSWDPTAGPDGRPRQDWAQRLIDGGEPAVVQPPTLVERFLEDEWLSICDLVIRRRALDSVGGYEPMFAAMFEDQVFHSKVLTRLPALVTVDCWYRYRQHPAACTAVAHRHGDHRLARLAFLDWLDGHLAKSGPLHPSFRRTVRRLRRPLRYPNLWRAARLVKRLTGRRSGPGVEP